VRHTDTQTDRQRCGGRGGREETYNLSHERGSEEETATGTHTGTTIEIGTGNGDGDGMREGSE
jgi:hypothetical protein